MTIDLSLRMKFLALAGLLLAGCAAVSLLLLHQASSSKPVVTPVTHHTQPHTATHRPTPAPVHSRPAVQLDTSLPSPLRHALLRSRTVVAVVYAAGDPADAAVLGEARQGAKDTHVGFVVLDVANDKVAGETATWLNHVVEPAVVIVSRPGTISSELDGYADSTMVAQAVVDSRR